MTKTDNKYLGKMIKFCDKNNSFNIADFCQKYGISNTDFTMISKSLKSKNYLIDSDLSTLHICPSAFVDYVSPLKRFLLFTGKLLLLTVKNVVIFCAGILSGIATAYLTDDVIAFLDSLFH